ncbi:hypothetical protein FSP39_000510 [Pinctada imbricata]|uniref:SOCS box domain-containing protein n=1 Tax=Pinctada imbricata TaxID=66713 RepID=A0AA89BPD7_PINIB|nr:hypothetical protein FSP39_000510 [Pinctada imbricata]
MELDIYDVLYNAVQENNITLCQEILQSKSLNLQRARSAKALGTPLLHAACMYRRSDIAKVLLTHGADISAVDHFGRTPIQILISLWPRAGPWDKPGDTMIDEIEREFWSRMISKHDESLKCLLILLAHGANANQKFNDNNSTALHVCSHRELFSALDALLLFGAGIEYRDNDLRTPLLHAAKHGIHRSVRHLLIQGADHRVEDKDGCTVLHLLAGSNRMSIEEMTSLAHIFPQLLNTMNFRTLKGHTSLHVACQNGDGEKIKFLLENNADPNIKDDLGRSPLYTLLDNNQPGQSVLGLLSLLEVTVQPSVHDRDGNLPKYLLWCSRTRFKQELITRSRSPVSLYALCIQRVIGCLKTTRRSVLHVSRLPLPLTIREEIMSTQQSHREFWQKLLFFVESPSKSK